MLHRLRSDKKAISPAISTVIITSAIVVMLLITVVFANNYMNARMAENEFNAMKQFMQTIGLQIDDVAWTVGRTQTMSYASKFGQITFQTVALNYALYVNSTNTWIANFTTGALFFNMPTSSYNIANGYKEFIFPTSNSSFLLQGTSAPISHVFVIERVPMNDGNYIRVVVGPSIRMLNSTVTTVSYYNFYLPILQPSGNNPHVSQSVTLTAVASNVNTIQNINEIRITVDFPQSALGFDSTFFNFNSSLADVQVPPGSSLEFYTGNVTVSLGVYA
ncbi:MAG: hypothetical protein ABSD73_04095 [Candidatus Bathyarchaeia archaeon]|jgi:hypothetical protein